MVFLADILICNFALFQLVLQRYFLQLIGHLEYFLWSNILHCKCYIHNLDETVGDYLSEYLTHVDTAIAEVTIRDLLTMSGGFDWNELTDPDWVYWNNWVTSDDHFIHALQVPIIHEPGQQWMNTISLIMNEVFDSVM